MCQSNKQLGGRYELLEMTGQGGMASIWRAVLHGAAGFHRLVAIKRILPDLNDEDFIAMFMEEARVGSYLQHPNIVQILDFGVDEEELYYLVMEWIDGISFREFVISFHQRGEMVPWPLVGAIGVEALRGLRAAHERIDSDGKISPVIHRDVTPSNILIGSDGIVRLTDFGVSRAMDRSSWTSPDIVKGKLTYIAPEIFDDVPASVQSDIFSLSIVLWEALAGRKLYRGKNAVEVFVVAREAAIPPLTNYRDDLPQELILALTKAMHPNPTYRFHSALEMSRILASPLRRLSEPVDDQVIAEYVKYARLTAASQSPPKRRPVKTKFLASRHTLTSSLVKPSYFEDLDTTPITMGPPDEEVIPLTRRKKIY